jgi:hypothetical protein
MIDHFAAFKLPRRPWLDEEALKQRFHRMTSEQHPDVSPVNSSAFAGLTKSYAILRDPAARLRHLLELEYPDFKASPAIPPALTERFMQVATLRREIHVFVEQHSASELPITQALSAAARFGLQRDVEKLATALELDRDRCLQLLQAEDELWEQRDAETPQRLATLQQELSSLLKWADELREGLLRLGN